MNSTIKALEEIGQNTSAKQFSSIPMMLDSLNIPNSQFEMIHRTKKEYVCALVPEDDEESTDEESTDEESTSEEVLKYN